MNLVRIVSFVVVAGVLGMGIDRMYDPHRTRLPFGTTDLSTVRPQLARLPKAERELVVGYVTRSGGDVLPPKFADPDAPLTARTFAEAIALQRRFLEGQAVVDAEVKAKRDAREAELAPLREALAVELADRAIVPRGEVMTHPMAAQNVDRWGATPALDVTPVLVTTYRVRNVGRRTMTALAVRVTIRAADGATGAPRGCMIDHHEALAPGRSVEIRCADASFATSASGADSAFAAMPAGALAVEWTPTLITFTDGTTLQYAGS